ncbi:hypothetical protein AYO38_00060 [bacterium SCGC AG-212-C10]|nr:hypothetical protein AYO38_00060 [bacterium SCGC AG-212-C10]
MDVDVLISADSIAARVRELAAQIDRDYEGSDNVVLLAVLKGSFVFVADLARAMQTPARVEFVACRSYTGTTGGEPELTWLPGTNLAGADVIVVEDIIERGTTLRVVLAAVETAGARSASVAALLRKPQALDVDLPPTYAGFDIDDEFVVGYGLDLDGKYRGLPFVGIVRG